MPGAPSPSAPFPLPQLAPAFTGKRGKEPPTLGAGPAARRGHQRDALGAGGERGESFLVKLLSPEECHGLVRLAKFKTGGFLVFFYFFFLNYPMTSRCEGSRVRPLPGSPLQATREGTP